MIKPDKIRFFSQLPQYIELEGSSGSFTISGSVAVGATASFSTTVTVDRATSKSDIYATNGNTGASAQISSVNFPVSYQMSGSGAESPKQYMSYGATSVTVTWNIYNPSGGPIALTTQTITINVVPYQLPI